VINLQALTNRLPEHLGARGGVQAERLVQELQVQELQDSIRAWQTRMQKTFRFLSKDPTAGNREQFYAILGEIINDLEVRVRETLNTISEDRLAPQDGENFYRLLGAYQGVSEAMDDYVASTDAIHWSRWKEEKIVL